MMEAIRKNGKKVIKNRLRGQNLNVIETTKNCSNFRMELQKWMKHQKKNGRKKIKCFRNLYKFTIYGTESVMKI